MLPAYHSEKALQPTAQSTQEALDQIKALVPSAQSALADAPEVAVSDLARSILRSPLPVESLVEESSGSEQSVTLGQLEAPVSASPMENIGRQPGPEQGAPAVIKQTVPKTTKSAKLKIDFAARLFKGLGR
jgi:hypothetical protein